MEEGIRIKDFLEYYKERKTHDEIKKCVVHRLKNDLGNPAEVVKKLTDWMVIACYIDGVDLTVSEIEIMSESLDYGLSVGVGVNIKAPVKYPPTILRWLCWINRKHKSLTEELEFTKKVLMAREAKIARVFEKMCPDDKEKMCGEFPELLGEPD